MSFRIALTAALVVMPAPVHAQSLFSAAGLGTPTEALDARSRALGNFGIGLWGSSIMPTDPAAASGLVTATGVMTAQPSWVEFSRSDGSENGTFQGARFPLVGLAYPAFGYGIVTLSFGSLLDQRFRATRDVVVDLASGPSDATDSFEQDGGVSVINFGFARTLAGRVSGGLAFGRYGGSLVRTLVRELGDVDVEGEPVAYEASGRWSYSGTLVTGGLSTELGGVARVAASVTWSGDLEAKVGDATTGSSRTFSLPLQYRLGGSAVLARGLLVTGSVARANWSGTEGLADAITAHPATRYGVGLELTRARIFGKDAPIRVGYGKSGLPFERGGRGAPTESALAGGFGLALSEQSGLLLAAVDLSVERGERKDSLLTESFWRVTVSLRVTGF